MLYSRQNSFLSAPASLVAFDNECFSWNDRQNSGESIPNRPGHSDEDIVVLITDRRVSHSDSKYKYVMKDFI